MASVDDAQRWWETAQADLKLRRGQSGKRLLEIAGPVGDSPERLLAAVLRIRPVLNEWSSEGLAPQWAVKLLRGCKKHVKVLRLVAPED